MKLHRNYQVLFSLFFNLFFCFSVLQTKCKPNPCLNGGTCTHVSGGFECSCSFGYKGETCERKQIFSFHSIANLVGFGCN